MLFIVLYHLCRHGFSVYLYDYTPTINNIFIKGVNQLGGLSNCIFLMISGYFLVEGHFSWKKVFKLWFQCFCVSASVGTFLYINRIPSVNHGGNLLEDFFTIANPLTDTEWKMYLRPIFFNGNWFTTMYLPFYIFSPFLAVMVKNLSCIQHRILILCTLFFGFVLNMIDYNPYGFSRLYYFCSIFFVASYLKLYQPKFFSKPKYCFLYAALILVFYFVYYFAVLYIGKKFGIELHERLRYIDKVYGMEHLPMLFCSMFIFSGFCNLQINYNKIINIISSCTLTVYLLHDNWLHRDFVWQGIFKILHYWQSCWFIPYAFFCVCCVFFAGIIFELFRKYFIEKYVLKGYDLIISNFFYNPENKKEEC